MKTLKYTYLFVAITTSLLFVQCNDDDNNIIINATCSDGLLNGDETGIDCGGTACLPCGQVLDFSGTYKQEDQVGRPGINTVFGTTGFKDAFNSTVPSEMQAAFQTKFLAKLIDPTTGLYPPFTTNALGLTAEEFTTVLSNDVLWVAKTGITTYFNGTEIFTGRALNDDVIDVSLLLIFGGPDGTENPTLTSDGVPTNDVAFSTSFPYLAGPF
ncbi:MAG: DUF4331 family protein [Flavobacteriaceae bacterium]|nr:DUF4331 family protein [Flavobacteriaceae bacterium]